MRKRDRRGCVVRTRSLETERWVPAARGALSQNGQVNRTSPRVCKHAAFPVTNILKAPKHTLDHSLEHHWRTSAPQDDLAPTILSSNILDVPTP